MKRKLHWFYKLLLATYVMAIIWTSVGHTAEYRTAGSPIASPVIIFNGASIPRARTDLRPYIQDSAKNAGVDPRVAQWIVSHESRHRPDATGDGGESRGLWQINKAWHPEVSDACAYDVTCSTDWSLARIRAGYVDEWSTWKYCRAWFQDCPF